MFWAYVYCKFFKSVLVKSISAAPREKRQQQSLERVQIPNTKNTCSIKTHLLLIAPQHCSVLLFTFIFNFKLLIFFLNQSFFIKLIHLIVISFFFCISGAPQVLRPHPSMHTISVKRGQPAVMSLVVCADPRPHRVSWEWGSLRLEAGSGIGEFKIIYFRELVSFVLKANLLI